MKSRDTFFTKEIPRLIDWFESVAVAQIKNPTMPMKILGTPKKIKFVDKRIADERIYGKFKATRIFHSPNGQFTERLATQMARAMAPRFGRQWRKLTFRFTAILRKSNYKAGAD